MANLELPTLYQADGYDMEIDEAMIHLQELRAMVADCLPKDVTDGIMHRLHAEKRYGEVEQAWIDEAVEHHMDAKGSHGKTVRELVSDFTAARTRLIQLFGEAGKPLTLAQIWYGMANRTIKEHIKQRDWSAIAGLWHATSRGHGLPTIKHEFRRTLIDEARKDGVDLVALADS